MAKKEYNESDIAQAWQKLAAEKFSHSTIKKEDIMTAIKKESNSSISQLKKGLKVKLYWTVGITFGLIVALVYCLGNPDLTVLLSIAIAVYVIGFISMYFKYREIEDGIMESEDILESMKSNAALIKSILRREQIWGLITFIPALMMGVLLGEISKGNTLIGCFQEPWILTKIIIAILVLLPIMTWTSNKMNKSAFGENLKNLEDNIIKMETLQ